ncbi:hypothetical protein [Domibacillus indicus]|uniref:hypothetical protein n=1 Tax=Domibacillus indicus TaxID=1437523 RepID=UPI0006180506|nr:hypothetical protein [Domibacillus indicus]
MGESIVPILIIGLIGYVLFKCGLLKMVVKIGYAYKHFGDKLSVSYKKFHGAEYYSFFFRHGEVAALTYEVTVEEGELCLEWRDGKETVWREIFTESRQGTYTLKAKHRLHVLEIKGKKTKGGFRVTFSRQQSGA